MSPPRSTSTNSTRRRSTPPRGRPTRTRLSYPLERLVHRLGAGRGRRHPGLAEGDERYLGFEQKLAERPTIEVPTITIASDFDGPNADGKAYADRFTGPYQHRILDGIGHNVPQEAPKVFAEAVIELARQDVAQPRS